MRHVLFLCSSCKRSLGDGDRERGRPVYPRFKELVPAHDGGAFCPECYERVDVIKALRKYREVAE